MSEEMVRMKYLIYFMDMFPNMKCDDPKLNKIVDSKCDISLISNKCNLDEIDLSTLRLAYNDYFTFFYSATDSKNINVRKVEKEYEDTKKNYEKFEKEYPEICSYSPVKLSFAIIESNLINMKQQKSIDMDKYPKHSIC